MCVHENCMLDIYNILSEINNRKKWALLSPQCFSFIIIFRSFSKSFFMLDFVVNIALLHVTTITILLQKNDQFLLS